MLRRSLSIIAMSHTPFDRSANKPSRPGSLLTPNRCSRPAGSHEKRSGFGRPRRADEPSSTAEILEWRFSNEDGKHHTGVWSRIAAQPIRFKRHDRLEYCLRAVLCRWRSLMLHILMLAAAVGFVGLCLIYSYPLTGTVFLGTLVYYALARS